MSTMNGTPRKSLATQLDRFDQMLEGLSEAIPEVVADTVRVATQQAVREAVEAAVKEVLTNPQIREKLLTTQPVAMSNGGAWQRVRQLWSGLRTTIACLRSGCFRGVECVRGLVTNLRKRMLTRLAGWNGELCVVNEYKGYVLTAMGVGAATAVVALVAGPYVAAVLSGIGGFGSTLAVQGGLWFRRIMGGQTE